MSIPLRYSLTRYLAAKKSVDDRALNWRVWQRWERPLPIPADFVGRAEPTSAAGFGLNAELHQGKVSYIQTCAPESQVRT